MVYEKLEWKNLQWDLQANVRNNALLPTTSAASAWRNWADNYSRRVRFRGRDGWRSVGPLDSLLKRISSAIQQSYDTPASVFGFVPGRSTFSAAEMHVGAESALVVDLKDFFGQITEQRVRSELAHLFDDEALDVVVGICLRESRLPLGFRTSPVISNQVFRETDLAIEKLCLAHSVKYTRWVDDLVFSGHSVDDAFLHELLNTLKARSWHVNEKKTRFMSARRVVLGLNVAKELERPHIPRGIKKELRKQVYYLQKFGIAHFSHAGAWPLPRILGMLAYVKSVDPNLAGVFEHQLASLPDDPRLMKYSIAAGGGKWQLTMLKDIGL